MSYRFEQAEGMIIERDVTIAMDDGVAVRADVFRPVAEGRYPIILSYGPYAKGLHFGDGYTVQWKNLLRDHPEVGEGTTSRHANWETADPEKWVPDGYVCIRVDSRGSGQSPGFVDPFSPREARDFYDCIEWAGVQPWSNGKVGLLGVSYFAQMQWIVAALHPPHLAAMCPFEGSSDFYREGVRHGGILSTFWLRWYPRQVENVQHGLGFNGRIGRATGRPIAGDVTLAREELAANRTILEQDHVGHEFLDQWFEGRVPDLSKIEVPLLSCGNWGGQGLHLRGNVEGFVQAGSVEKWLEMHTLEHWTEFYTDYGVQLQKRFFDHYLKGIDNSWEKQTRLLLRLRTPDGIVERAETSWPLERTAWTSLHLDADAKTLRSDGAGVSGSISFRAMTAGVIFHMDPVSETTEITGPVSATIFASTTTADMDLFVTLRLFDTEGDEVLFVSAVDPNAPVTQGWLRASHRSLDPEKSTPWRPWHRHLAPDEVTPGEIYELAIELWPTSIIVPAGFRLALTVAGQDFDHGLEDRKPVFYGTPQHGCSVFLHDNPVDRPADRFGGTTTIYTGRLQPSKLLLPIITGRT